MCHLYIDRSTKGGWTLVCTVCACLKLSAVELDVNHKLHSLSIVPWLDMTSN